MGGLGPCVSIVGWVGLGEEKWAHVHLCAATSGPTWSRSGPVQFRLVTVASLPALWPWAPPAERSPSLESIYRVSLTVDLCEGNEIISFTKFITPQPVGGPS